MKSFMKAFLVPVLFLLAPSLASAALVGNTLKSQLSVNLTTASTLELPANISRAYLLIQNLGTDFVLVKFGSAISSTEGIQIVPGGNYEPNSPSLSAVYMKSNSGTQPIMIIEGVQ